VSSTGKLREQLDSSAVPAQGPRSDRLVVHSPPILSRSFLSRKRASAPMGGTELPMMFVRE